jgi:tetratricopeptide (TPR) repeat protein
LARQADVARPNQMAAFAEAPGRGWPEAGLDAAAETGEAALAQRKAVLRATCEDLFLELREAGPAEAAGLRDRLQAAHKDLLAMVDQVANRPWDGMELAEQQAEIGQLLVEAVQALGRAGLVPLSEAMAGLRVGRMGPAGQVLAELAGVNSAPAELAARLAYARGLIAEAALRWTDAAVHFAEAARLYPDLPSLRKARALACRTGDLTAAFRFGKGLLVLAETNGSTADRALAMAEHALTLEAQDRLDEAEGMLRKAVLLGREGASSADQARHLADLARVLEAQERFAEADGVMRKALAVTRDALGEGHPAYCARLNGLALLLQAQDRDDEAEALHLKALDLAGRLPGAGHPVAIDCLSGLAQLFETRGRLDLAERYYRQALQLEQTLIGRTHPDFAGRICALAEVVGAQRRLPEAETLFRTALEIDRATVGEAHRDYGIGLNNLAGVVEAQGRPAEAEVLYATALAIFRASLGDLHPATQKVTRNFRALIAAHVPNSPHRPGVEALWAAGQVADPSAGSAPS